MGKIKYPRQTKVAYAALQKDMTYQRRGKPRSQIPWPCRLGLRHCTNNPSVSNYLIYEISSIFMVKARRQCISYSRIICSVLLYGTMLTTCTRRYSMRLSYVTWWSAVAPQPQHITRGFMVVELMLSILVAVVRCFVTDLGLCLFPACDKFSSGLKII